MAIGEHAGMVRPGRMRIDLTDHQHMAEVPDQLHQPGQGACDVSGVVEQAFDPVPAASHAQGAQGSMACGVIELPEIEIAVVQAQLARGARQHGIESRPAFGRRDKRTCAHERRISSQPAVYQS